MEARSPLADEMRKRTTASLTWIKTVTAQSPAIVLCRMSHMVMVSVGLIVRYMAQLPGVCSVSSVISERKKERGRRGDARDSKVGGSVYACRANHLRSHHVQFLCCPPFPKKTVVNFTQPFSADSWEGGTHLFPGQGCG